jgi:hypothetical protein
VPTVAVCWIILRKIEGGRGKMYSGDGIFCRNGQSLLADNSPKVADLSFRKAWLQKNRFPPRVDYVKHVQIDAVVKTRSVVLH